MGKAKRSEPFGKNKALWDAIEKYGDKRILKIQHSVIGNPTSSVKTAERMLYDRPTDGQAVKTTLSKNQQKQFEKNYQKLHDTPV